MGKFFLGVLVTTVPVTMWQCVDYFQPLPQKTDYAQSEIIIPYEQQKAGDVLINIPQAIVAGDYLVQVIGYRKGNVIIVPLQPATNNSAPQLAEKIY